MKTTNRRPLLLDRFQRRTGLFSFPLLIVALAQFTVAPDAAALPTGGQVTAGNVTVNVAGTQLTLDQSSRAAIMNWQSFNIAPNELVRVLQSGPDAALLARVTGGDPSQLLGRLQADGGMFLINPRGVVIGPGALIDTAAFMASTLDVSDQDFLGGRNLTFKGDSAAGIVNFGKITAAEGNVALIAHTVKNEGALLAPKGTVSLVAGTEVFLAAPDAPSVVVRTNLPVAAERSGVDNRGVIEAAQAQLEAAGGSIYELAINQSGVIRSTGVERRGGRVLLTAGGGNVGVAGAVSARHADGSGGEILVGGDYRGGNSEVANATNTFVTSTAVLDAGANPAGGSGGRVVVWADHKTRFDGSLSAAAGASGDGGWAEVSGKEILQFNGTANLGAPGGKAGSLLLDPRSITVVAGTTSPLPAGLNDSSWTSAEDAGTDQTIGADTLAALLASGSVTLEATSAVPTSGELEEVNIKVAAPLAWNSAHSLTLRAAGDIEIDANITAPNATLNLRLGQSAAVLGQGDGGLFNIFSRAESASGTTVTVGKLAFGWNQVTTPPTGFEFAANPEVGGVSFDGNLVTPLVEMDLSGGGTALGLFGAGNDIDAIRTTGTGPINFFYVQNGTGALNLKLTAAGNNGWITASTPGMLTLESGSSLSFTNPSNVILASTDSGFTNLAGAAPFGANARFLVYSKSPGLTNKGGLVGSEVFSEPYDIDTATFFPGDTVNRFLFSIASGLPVLTYTADNKTRFYGSADPAFTATVTGLQGGDQLAGVVTGAPSFSVAAGQNSGVGNYTITPQRNTLLSATYDFSFAPGTLVINPAPLTITAADASRTVNHPNPPFSVSYAGFVLGQTESVVSDLQVATTAVQGSVAGNYPITPSGATAPNYAITFVPGTLSVTNTAALSITANNASRLYGAANPSFSSTFSGFLGGDTASIVTGLQYSVSATAQSGVGNYTITPFGATAPGYLIDYFPGTLTIDPAPLTISAQAVSRLYGDANPAFTPTFAGFVNGDTAAAVSGTVTLATAATETTGVGNYAITVSGGTAANYAITRVPGNLSITPAPLTVKADDKTRLYGDPDPALTVTTTGLKNGDQLQDVVFFSVGPTPFSLASANSGIGSYGILLQGSGFSPNYNVTVQSGSLQITPRPLTIATDPKTKFYGEENPQFTTTFTGLAAFDTPAAISGLNLTTQATLESGPSLWGIVPSGGFNQNYAISYQVGQLEVLPAPLNIAGFMPALSRVYGRANPSATMPEVTGLKFGQTAASLGLQFQFPALTAGAGDYTYSLTENSPYYSFGAANPTGSFHIDPAPLQIQLGGGGRLYGEANPASYGTRVQGVVTAFGDTVDSVLRVTNPADSSFVPGTYQLYPEILSPNYTLGSVTEGSYVIRPRLLTVDIDSIARYYGDPTPDFSWKVGGDGLAPADNITAVMHGVRTAVPVDARTDVGYYRIDPVYQNNPGYVVSWWPGYLAILPRPVEVTVRNGISFGNDNLPYNFSASALGVDLISFHNGDPGGSGYSGFVTNLPSFMTQTDYFTAGYFELRNTNDPMPVSTAIDLASVTFPARPVAPTPPQAPSAPLPGSLPVMTAQFETAPLVIPSQAPDVTGSSYVILTDFTIQPAGNFTISGLEAPKDTTKDKFPDVIRFIVPRGFGGKNFAVTKITNGMLTMKADPVVVQRVHEQEAAAAKRKADREAFYMTGQLPVGTIRLNSPVAFNLPKDLIPSIRDAIGFAIYQEIIAGDASKEGSLAWAMNGGQPVYGWHQLPEDKIMAWLADVHTNPAKQAMLAPAMMAYTMGVATKPPEQRTDQQHKLMAYILPALADGRDKFIANAKQSRDEWHATEGATRGNTMMALFDGKVPYDQIIGDAVADSMGQTMQSFDQKAAEAAAKTGIHLAGGAAAGAGAAVSTGVALGSVNVFKAIFPFAAQAIKKLADTSITLASSASSAAAGPATVIGIAVTIIITEATAVADNEEARKNFEKLLDPNNTALNPNEMAKSDTGKAMMMLGLANLFLGGGKG